MECCWVIVSPAEQCRRRLDREATYPLSLCYGIGQWSAGIDRVCIRRLFAALRQRGGDVRRCVGVRPRPLLNPPRCLFKRHRTGEFDYWRRDLLAKAAGTLALAGIAPGAVQDHRRTIAQRQTGPSKHFVIDRRYVRGRVQAGIEIARWARDSTGLLQLPPHIVSRYHLCADLFTQRPRKGRFPGTGTAADDDESDSARSQMLERDVYVPTRIGDRVQITLRRTHAVDFRANHGAISDVEVLQRLGRRVVGVVAVFVQEKSAEVVPSQKLEVHR